MINTISAFRSYYDTQTTDGTNDYYSGINGTNSFSITPFAGLTGMTFSILINFPVQIDSTVSQRRLFEVADSTRTNLLAFDVGAFSGALTDEYIGVSLVTGTTKSSARCNAAESIAVGWNHIAISVGSAVNPTIAINGVSFTVTNNAFGAPQTATSTFTANKVGLMASSSGSVPTAATWREALVINQYSSIGAIQGLYNYYTRNGNVPLANSKRSAWRYLVTPSSRATIAGFWRGNESGTNLLDMTASTGNLTKTNF